jgi:hypothetical protein
MPHPGEQTIGGGTHARRSDALALNDTLAETGPGAPDEAIGPKDRALPELAELADSPEGRRIEQKLRAEALARRGGDDEDAALEDPTGHA